MASCRFRYSPRSPMNAIIGYSGLIKKTGISPDKTYNYISKIQKAGKQLLALIDDIIDISKIESNQLSIQNEICNLNLLLYEIFEIIRRQ